MAGLVEVSNREILILSEKMEIIYSTLEDIDLIYDIIKNSDFAMEIQNNDCLYKTYESCTVAVQKSPIKQGFYYIVKIERLDCENGRTHNKSCLKHQQGQKRLRNCIEVIRATLNDMTTSPYGFKLTDEILVVSQQLDELIALYMQG
ncbi:MAG: Spo0E family sporulation regulatory protein-aspartic acid phosphatase [Clostridia bacterium]